MTVPTPSPPPAAPHPGDADGVPVDGLPEPRRTWATIAVALAIMMAVIDGTMASTALPTIARQFQEEQLTGQNKRFQAGLATNFEVLQTQRDLADARAAELRSLINLKKSIVALNNSTFTLLTQNQLEIALTR